MKANVFFRTVWVAVVILASVTGIKAQNGSYYTNDVIEGDQVTTRFVYKTGENGLQYHVKHNFTYDQENRLSSKETLLWDNKTQDWFLQSDIYYSYIGSEIFVAGNCWNQKEQNYTRNVSQFSYDADNLPIAMVSDK